MPECATDAVMLRRLAATAALDGYFSSITGASRLPAQKLDRYRQRGYVLGWQVHVDFSDGIQRELHVLADQGFPYNSTRIVIANGPGPLAWPHVEADGFLCILPPDTAISSETPVAVAKYVLGEACQLIEDGVYGRNVDEFRREFMSYWAIASGECSPRYIALLEPHGPGRSIQVWRGDGIRVAAEGREALRRWLRRSGVNMSTMPQNAIAEGALIWLPEPLVPSEYPRTAADMRALAKERSPAALDILDSLATSATSGFDALLAAQTPNGACFAAVALSRPQFYRGPGCQVDMLTKGFRPGRVPREVVIKRQFQRNSIVRKSPVERADHSWIHGRDRDAKQERLRNKRVAVLGCGSLGAALARMIAQAGVGSLLLSDPGVLDWPNLSRHELGAQSVRRAKAVELGKEIEKSYPHLGPVLAKCDRVGPGAKALLADLRTCDLIVSTMGNWAAESFLNELQQLTEGFPPILYGWVEPHAAAAHALLITDGGGCLRCGTNDKGQPDMAVTVWPNGVGDLQAPACGAIFSPYGPAELAWAHALLAEASVDTLIGTSVNGDLRTWIAPRDRVENAGGSWSRSWVESIEDPGSGGITMRNAWPKSVSCPVCSQPARVA